MKKIISLLLAMLLAAGCLSVMVGCSDNGADNKDETTPADSGATPSGDVGEEETEWIDPFAGTDFGGRAFRVSSSIDENDATNADYLIRGSEELNGESVTTTIEIQSNHRLHAGEGYYYHKK